MDDFIKLIAVLADIFAIAASGLAVYIYSSKRKEISSVFNLLINHTYQLSLSEVKEKIERLNEYNAKSPDDYESIVNIFNEIIGQIRGNEKLSNHFCELLTKMEVLVKDKRKLTEPRKRVIVSELRERLRNLKIKSIDNLVGESHE